VGGGFSFVLSFIITEPGRDVVRKLRAENGERGDQGGKTRGEERERGTWGEVGIRWEEVEWRWREQEWAETGVGRLFLLLLDVDFFCYCMNWRGNKGGKKGKNGRGRVEERGDDLVWWPPSKQGSWTKWQQQNKGPKSKKGTTTLTRKTALGHIPASNRYKTLALDNVP
jgi:hypothetical protein